jgi:hypothetical protein
VIRRAGRNPTTDRRLGEVAPGAQACPPDHGGCGNKTARIAWACWRGRGLPAPALA